MKKNPRTIHVSVGGSDETGDGTAEKPFCTIRRALEEALKKDTIYVEAGNYTVTVGSKKKRRIPMFPFLPLPIEEAP